MLNIGKLSSGAAEYYIGEVASAAEDYYAGHGEAAGRWVGSIARELGLEGEVDPDQFRRVLNGQHPFADGYLVSSQGSASRARARDASGHAPDNILAERVDTLRAAAHLGVSRRYVTGLLSEGDAYRTKLAVACEGEEVPEPSAYLLGEKADGNGRYGSASWSVTRDELERFVERRRESKARPGYDLTLRPPKSVSVLWAVAEPDERAEIRRAHSDAVDEVVRYYEGNAVFVRHGGGARHLVLAGGIVAGAFDHRTSRAGDPLLHTHVVTANMTSTINARGEMEWRTIPGAGLFEHAKAAGHLYQAHLRHLLTLRLGVEFGPVVNGHADITGVPEQVVDLFSKRRTEIGEMLSEAGSTSARAAQIATLETRKAKDYGVDAETVEAGWRVEAAEAGFGPEQVAACFGRVSATEVTEGRIGVLMETLGGPHGLTERSATFARTDVIEAVACAVGSAASARRVEALTDRFLASSRALLVDKSPLVEVVNGDVDPQRDPQREPQRARVRRSSTQKLYTTPDLARLEEQLLESASNDERTASRVATDMVDRVIAGRPELSVEQQAMVGAACGSTELIQPIMGRPGAGKTYATEAVVAAHVAAGVPIIGCSVSATAAGELERAAGFARSTGAPATTVARLLLELDGPYGGLRPGTVIAVDEASMIGTRDLARLTSAARAAGGAVKLIGDPDQHGAVDVGGVFRRLCADRGDALVTLVENNRQQDHTERLAVTDYREGRIADALGRYDEAGKIVRSRTAGESFDAIVADWYAARVDGRADPMIAGPNSTRRALNERARTLLRSNGELAGPTLIVAGREFQVGDEVVARRNDRTLHARGSRDYVKNGSAGTVNAIEGADLMVCFEREGTICVPHRYLVAGRLEHGYARTTYGVQGATHDIARYHPTDVSSFEEGYVAITRARTEARIYVVDGALLGPDDDLSHVPDDPRPFGIAEVAAALGRRRGGHMAADAAGHLSAVAATAEGRTLAQLTLRRRELDRILADAPPATDQVIDDVGRTLDALRTRRNLWQDALDHVTRPISAPETDPDATVQRASSAIGHLDRAITGQGHKLDAALRQQTRRLDWLEEHAEIVSEHDLVRRGERAREIQVRTAALQQPAGALLRLIGPEPSLQRDRHVWQRAIEAAAVYRERYDAQPAGNRGIPAVLGERPAAAVAGAEYAEAARMIAEAQSVTRIAERGAGLEL